MNPFGNQKRKMKMARQKGFLTEFAKKAGCERVPLKKITCANEGCGKPLFIYADKQGWPYTICDSAEGCDHENKPHSMTSAKPLLARDGKWNPKLKSKIDKALEEYLKLNEPEPEPEQDPFADFDDVEETENPKPEPEEKEGWKFFS